MLGVVGEGGVVGFELDDEAVWRGGCQPHRREVAG